MNRVLLSKIIELQTNKMKSVILAFDKRQERIDTYDYESLQGKSEWDKNHVLENIERSKRLISNNRDKRVGCEKDRLVLLEDFKDVLVDGILDIGTDELMDLLGYKEVQELHLETFLSN